MQYRKQLIGLLVGLVFYGVGFLDAYAVVLSFDSGYSSKSNAVIHSSEDYYVWQNDSTYSPIGFSITSEFNEGVTHENVTTYNGTMSGGENYIRKYSQTNFGTPVTSNSPYTARLKGTNPFSTSSSYAYSNYHANFVDFETSPNHGNDVIQLTERIFHDEIITGIGDKRSWFYNRATFITGVDVPTSLQGVDVISSSDLLGYLDDILLSGAVWSVHEYYIDETYTEVYDPSGSYLGRKYLSVTGESYSGQTTTLKSIPEPTTLALMGFGLLAGIDFRRRRKKDLYVEVYNLP